MLDIIKCMQELQKNRKWFVSEADFQLELAWTIKKLYPSVQVRLEYIPSFDQKMHIDILVIMNSKWIPIELKYKTKEIIVSDDDGSYKLKNHSAKDVNCYLYLYDIHRIEIIRENKPEFEEGYTVFLTNDLSYTRPPMKPFP